MHRRTLLTGAGAAMAALAGCSLGQPGATPTPGPTTPAPVPDDPTTTEAPTTTTRRRPTPAGWELSLEGAWSESTELAFGVATSKPLYDFRGPAAVETVLTNVSDAPVTVDCGWRAPFSAAYSSFRPGLFLLSDADLGRLSVTTEYRHNGWFARGPGYEGRIEYPVEHVVVTLAPEESLYGRYGVYFSSEHDPFPEPGRFHVFRSTVRLLDAATGAVRAFPSVGFDVQMFTTPEP